MTDKAILFAMCLCLAQGGIAQESARPANLTYHADIAPLLKKHCHDCHSADQSDGGFRVDNYEDLLKGGEEAGAAVVPGRVNESPLIEFLTGKRLPRMPKQRKALLETEIATVRLWIKQGAKAGKPRAPAPVREEQLFFFESNIRPLLARHCGECHGEDQAKGSLAFLSRDDLLRGGTRGAAIVPGDPERSLLIEAVRQSGALQMPKNAAPLDGEAIALLETWIAMGAPWPQAERSPPKLRSRFTIYPSDRQHWAFQPRTRPEIPASPSAAWPQDDLDRFVLARLEAAQLTPAPPAPRATLLRRIAFDLTGLPPAVEDVERFGNSTQASLEAFVDELLASDEFGNHWARHWLDHVRYRPNPKKTEHDDPYRQWVARAFHEDMPYDRFLKMQIAGDLLPAQSPDEVHLDGLIAVRPWSLKSRPEQQIDLLGRTFLGLSLICARCHDHKLEPIGRDDYFAILGIFESSQVVKVPLLKEKSRFEAYMAGLAQTQANEARMRKELKKWSSLAALVDLRERITTERAKVGNSDYEQQKVRANLDKLEAAEEKRLAQIENKQLDLEADEAREYMRLRQANNAFAKRWKDVYQLDALVDQTDTDNIRDAAPPLLDVKTKPGKTPPKGPPVPRRFPKILAASDQPPLGEITNGSGRIELANWLAHANHPITARLMTNRIWYYLMGEGLTPSLSNFGRSGRAPSHPELLDYLSDEFVKHNWSMKALIRRIVLSSTYQQTATLEVGGDEQDQRRQLFGIARRKRLEAEAILRTLAWLEFDPTTNPTRRSPPPDMVEEMRLLFDGANRNLIVPRRTSSISPLQALFLMNSPHIQSSAARIASRLCQIPGDGPRIRQLHRLAFSRDATAEEVDDGIRFLAGWEVDGGHADRAKGQQVPPKELARWQAYVQVVLLSNEFMYVD